MTDYAGPPGYRVLCADLLTNTVREELPVHDLKWDVVLNAPGSLSGWVSLDHAKTTRSNLDPGATAIYLERGGLLVWGGILWTALPDTGERRVELGAEGFWSYFRRRRIRANKIYTAEDQLFIARDLVNYAQAQTGGNIGVTVGAEVSGVDRDRSYYGYERKNLGEAVEQLAAVEGGFDFSIDVAWSGGTPTKTLVLHYPRRGARRDGLIFNHNLAGVAKAKVPIDATAAANLVDALGEGDGDAMLIATRADNTLLSRYPLLEDVVSYKDVKETDTLTGHAAGELARRRLPVELPELEKQASTWPDFGSFSVGDEGLVVVDDGYIQLSSYWRVQALTMTVDDEGQETMIPQFVTADAFA